MLMVAPGWKVSFSCLTAATNAVRSSTVRSRWFLRTVFAFGSCGGGSTHRPQLQASPHEQSVPQPQPPRTAVGRASVAPRARQPARCRTNNEKAFIIIVFLVV